MKISKELMKVLKACEQEVNSWPIWKRSLDPIGDAGKEKYKRTSRDKRISRNC